MEKSPLISPIEGKCPNKRVFGQGYNAALAGFTLADNPYYDTSTKANLWAKGFKSK